VLPERQWVLLSLLDELGGDVPNLDFQKLLLLYCNEADKEPIYEFVPYRYGGFSFSLYADKRKLTEKGYLADQERAWILTDQGRAAIQTRSASLTSLESFARRYSGLRGDALIAETYRRFPYYAVNSEIAERVLAQDEHALRAVATARPTTRGAGLCTIGYQGRSLEGYLNLLMRESVTLLCDVRRNPLSRKYGFSKGTLAKGCEGVGIRYEHLPELGIASSERRDLRSSDDYNRLFARYTRETLQRETNALSRIADWIRAGHRVALTCYERDAAECHRLRVAQALSTKAGRTIEPVHL
jgi:uncharacterized protein (DUF488 family)